MTDMVADSGKPVDEKTRKVLFQQSGAAHRKASGKLAILQEASMERPGSC